MTRGRNPESDLCRCGVAEGTPAGQRLHLGLAQSHELRFGCFWALRSLQRLYWGLGVVGSSSFVGRSLVWGLRVSQLLR